MKKKTDEPQDYSHPNTNQVMAAFDIIHCGIQLENVPDDLFNLLNKYKHLYSQNSTKVV